MTLDSGILFCLLKFLALDLITVPSFYFVIIFQTDWGRELRMASAIIARVCIRWGISFLISMFAVELCRFNFLKDNAYVATFNVDKIGRSRELLYW